MVCAYCVDTGCLLQMAAAFALGASGVVLGTVLNTTYESVYPEAKKQALLKAGSAASCKPSTIRTTLYDELTGVPWPPAVDGNCLRNEFTAEYSSQTPLQVSCESSNSYLGLAKYCVTSPQAVCSLGCQCRTESQYCPYFHETKLLRTQFWLIYL